MSGDEKLNPQIKEVEIGRINLRKIKIYPMAMAEEAKFVKLVEDVLNTYLQTAGATGKLTEEGLPVFIGAVTKVLGENIVKLIGLVLNPEEIEPEDFFKNTTNFQMSEILNHIVRDNFEEPSKNLIGLFKDFKSMFQLKRPSLQSLSDTLNLDSIISTEEDIEKEESPQAS